MHFAIPYYLLDILDVLLGDFDIVSDLLAQMTDVVGEDCRSWVTRLVNHVMNKKKKKKKRNILEDGVCRALTLGRECAIHTDDLNTVSGFDTVFFFFFWFD